MNQLKNNGTSYGVVLFETAHDAILGEKKIRGLLSVALMPIPSQFAAGCGIVLRFEKTDEIQIRELLQEYQIPGRIEWIAGITDHNVNEGKEEDEANHE